MKLSFIILLWVTFLLHCGELKSQQYPSYTISNGLITAKLYLPDTENGFYRSSRFDWSGIICELKYEGNRYFGQWYPNHNPEVNDAICGPAEEFQEIDYDLADDNREFLKIGVGGLRKSKEKGYNKFKLYEITNPGEWLINKADSKIEFIHMINDVAGYSYKYTKSIELVNGKSEFLIKHTLENTGKRTIKTNVYNHNFFTIGGLPTGPDVAIEFSKNIIKEPSDNENNIVDINQNRIRFKKELAPHESVMITDILGKTAKNSLITIENKRLKTGVVITSDTEYSTIHFWASQRAYCPEPYIDIEVPPGKKTDWSFIYRLYTIK